MMLRLKLGRFALLVVVAMVFIKIYQHNLIIRLNYEKQRLALKKTGLKKQKSDLLRQLCYLKNSSSMTNFATESLSMDKLKFSQVMTFTGL